MALPLKELIVGYDFSDAATSALQAGAALARSCGAAIRVVTATHRKLEHRLSQILQSLDSGEASVSDEPLDLLDGVERLARDELGRIGSGEVCVTFEVAPARPAGMIIERTTSGSADLVLLGGRAARPRRLDRHIGCVAERVVRRSPVPVLIRAPDHPFPPRSILCAVGLSDQTRGLLDWAAGLAEQFDAPLTVLHVLEHGFPVRGIIRGRRLRNLLAHQTREATERIQGLLSPHRIDVPVTPMIGRGLPSQEITSVLHRRGHDLLCIGNPGRHPALENLVGGTATWVIQRAPCSVLAVPTAAEAVSVPVTPAVSRGHVG